MMKLSIIIPTYNEEKYLPQLLDSIKSQTFTDYEIIIADAQSKDRTREIAKSYGCKVVDGGLPALGRNSGAQIAEGEVLLFLDSDLMLTEGYLQDAMDEFEENNLGIAITQMVPLSDKRRDKFLHQFANRFMIMVESIKPHGAGCYGIIVQKALHEEVDGFNESLDFGEDTDYIERIGRISTFKVLRKPRVLVSTRRLEKEGLRSLAFKYTKSTVYDFMGKRISAGDLDYEFGYDEEDSGDAEKSRKSEELLKIKNLPPIPQDSGRKRIIYSVCGEGMGHAIRGGVILEHLTKKYDVLIFASDRAYEYLSKKFDNVYEIYGFNTVYKDNKVKDTQTFVKAMKTFPRDLKDNLRLLNRIAKNFKPHIVVSDFEFYASLLSNLLRIPLISLDNMHVITQCKIEYPSKYKKDKYKAEGVVRSFIVRPERYIITSFYAPEIKNPEKVVIFPPILRKEIMEMEGNYGDHILVYQTSQSNIRLIEILQQIPEKFIIYGFDRDDTLGNLQFSRFNEDQFFEDMKSAKAVITNGGFTLISEALHLKKPVLSIPVKGQFEQIINAVYLEKLGYGELHPEISQESVKSFLSNLDTYQDNLKDYENGDNQALFDELDASIEKYAKKLH